MNARRPAHPLDLSPEERRARFAAEFGDASRFTPYPPRAKDAEDLAMDRRVMHPDDAADLVPLVWPRR